MCALNASISRATALTRLEKLPLRFEPNQGQTSSSGDFIVRGVGYQVSLRSTEMIFRSGGEYVRLHLPGARFSRAEGRDPQESVTNYFIGHDPARWRVGIPSYGRVHYREIYPGIDVDYYSNQGRIEFDFTVAPGADTRDIVLAFDGIQGMYIDRAGDLVLKTRTGELRQHRATLYQFRANKKVPIKARYRLAGRNRATIQIEDYDRSRVLAIDPILSYSTYVGGSGRDQAIGFAIDAAGNAYLGGWTTSTDLPANGAQPRFGGGEYGDAFVLKINASGTGIVYCTYLGGAIDESVWALAVDRAGNAYVTGRTRSKDFPITSGAYQTTLRGDVAAFVTKISASGRELAYSTFLGGSTESKGLGIVVNSAGIAYVTGQTWSPDFPVTPGALKSRTHGKDDVFVTALDRTGASLIYSSIIGGSQDDWANAIDLDSGGSVYLTGYTQSPDFPTTTGAYQTQFLGGKGDCFVAKLNPTGTALVYSTLLATDTEDFGRAIAVDSAGNAYVGGRTGSAQFPVTHGAFQTTFGGVNDSFVTKLNADGSRLVYSTLLGGRDNDQVEGLTIDSAGVVYIGGLSQSDNFPTTPDAVQSSARGRQTGTFTMLSADGSKLLFSTYLGGTGGTDLVIGVAVDSSKNTYVMGSTDSKDIPTTKDAYQPNFGGGSAHMFVTKMDFSVHCSYRLGSNSKSFSRTGGSARVTLTAPNGCPWRAVADAGWLTIRSGAGTGKGSIAFAVPPNMGEARSTVIQVAGQTITVHQKRR